LGWVGAGVIHKIRLAQGLQGADPADGATANPGSEPACKPAGRVVDHLENRSPIARPGSDGLRGVAIGQLPPPQPCELGETSDVLNRGPAGVSTVEASTYVPHSVWMCRGAAPSAPIYASRILQGLALLAFHAAVDETRNIHRNSPAVYAAHKRTLGPSLTAASRPEAASGNPAEVSPARSGKGEVPLQAMKIKVSSVSSTVNLVPALHPPAVCC